MNNTPNTTKDSQSIVYTYVNWITLSIKDWISALTGKLKFIKFPGEPIFQSFKALWLIRQIDEDPDPIYRQKFQKIIQKRLPNWQTTFQKFTRTTHWKIHELRGITFWLAFPLLIRFNKFPNGFAYFLSSIALTVYNLQDDSIDVIKIHIKAPFTLYVITDQSKCLYIFSSGAGVHTVDPWLSFQIAFLLYNLFPLNKFGWHRTKLKPFNRLTWFWRETIIYSLLDLPPTFTANSAGEMIRFDRFRDPETHWVWHFLDYLGEVYNKESWAVYNLYEWLQCVIRSIPEEPVKVYGYKPDPLILYNNLEPKVRLVAAITDKEITPEILEPLIKRIPQPH